STYGGNPLACKVAIAALEVLKEEKLAERADELGKVFRARMQKLVDDLDFVTHVRGRGLLNAVIIKPLADGRTAWDVCVALKEAGVLAKPTHGDIIRFAPTLVISREELEWAMDRIEEVLRNFTK
ncbi:MAG TPA: aminotransferase class III-fold pyridoxal phosphate-dependent enzyme, partial [Calditrichia bacterium]|nr:aminotransferase class III-fold pyridoxal phosphate-dependent enzyme [Calditrichia bacterium]